MRVLAAALLAITGALAAPQLSSAAPLRAANACPDVIFIGARGSGENDGKVLAKTHSLGPEVDAIAEELRSRLKHDGETMRSYSIPYTAESVDVLKPSKVQLAMLATGDIAGFVASYVNHNFKRYNASINEGIRMFRDAIDVQSSACEDSDLVVSGYSQGAIAAHQAELQLDDVGDEAGDAVIGTILLGDGDRVPNSAAKSFGSSRSSGQGIRTYLHANDARDLPDPEDSVEICDDKDIVCDFNATNAASFGKSSAVHTQYLKRKSGRLLIRATDWLDSNVLGD